MELFRSESHYIFVKNESSLWWDRSSGKFSVKSAWDLSSIEDIECLGITDGIVGIAEHTNIYEPRLMIIKESSPVGQLYFHHTIYKIKSVAFLNLGLNNNVEIELQPCTKHGSFSNQVGKTNVNKMPVTRLFENSTFLNKTLGAVKQAGNTIKSTTQQAASQVKQTVTKKRDLNLDDRIDKRLTDELHKIFDDTDSFYYARTIDITNSLQRQYDSESQLMEQDPEKPITDLKRWWRYADDRFFWNKYMMKDIIALGSPECDNWILPIIQGYVQISQCSIDPLENNPLNTDSLSGSLTNDETFTLALISRRSRYQAGTRYNRRGIEPGGKVANYVETEQIVAIVCPDSIHRTSFVQVRGSVPIYWSQPDYKFRPPPKIDKGDEETQQAFVKHFEEERSLYGDIVLINLVEQQGKEKIIWEAYSKHVHKYNSSNMTYVTFDFHEYCRGMHYENVSILINAISELISDMKFCWRDDHGIICSQTGVFRVNCMDCLDRTNVVQTAIAKWVLEVLLCRLGVGMGVFDTLKLVFLGMWADNGDALSRQYAGTKALKGDFTRTGERKITGIMKDGMASANRYYLSTFKDALRQLAIDVMTGESRAVPGPLIDKNDDTIDKEFDVQALAQQMKSLIDDCKKLLVPDTVPILGSWGLIEADSFTSCPVETEVDVILLLTAEEYLVADYDEVSDRILSVDRVKLADVTLIQLADVCSQSMWSMSKTRVDSCYWLRIHYNIGNEGGYFHTFRSTRLRFFNNMAIAIKNKEEMMESLRSIVESFQVARSVHNLPNITFQENSKIEKKKSKVPLHRVGYGENCSKSCSMYQELSKLPTISRNVHETQIVADIRSAGSKALSNVTEQFSKLNKLGHTLNAKAKPTLQLNFKNEKTRKIFTLGQNRSNPTFAGQRLKGSMSDGMSSDYSSDDENRTNIFEPTLDNFENNQRYIGDHRTDQKVDESCELIENPLYSSKIDTKDEPLFLPNTEIVLSEINDGAMVHSNRNTPIATVKRNPFDMIDSDSSSVTKTPEIQVDCDDECRLQLPHKLSHSSFDINTADDSGINRDLNERQQTGWSGSQTELGKNITQSHSESALKQLMNVASPVSSTTKDFVLSPLSKIAKGVQTLGANLDPRKIKNPNVVRHVSEKQYEAHKLLQETWKDCNTKLIAL